MPIGRRSPEVEACCVNQILSGRNCGTTLFWKLVFCAGKLSDVMYVPPWAYRDSWGKGKPYWIILPTKYQVGDDFP